MTIVETPNGPHVTSLYDWGLGHVVPALLSDTEVALPCDLRAIGNGHVEVLRLGEDDSPEVWNTWAKTYAEASPPMSIATELGRSSPII